MSEPEAPTQKRRTDPTPEKLEEFLEVLGRTCNATFAAESLNLSRERLYEMRRADKDFEARWNAARQMGYLTLEDEAARRALAGYDETTTENGKVTKIVHKYSETLLMFLLNGGMPEKYRHRVSAELSGKGGGPIETAERTVAALAETADPNAAARIYSQMVSGSDSAS